MSVCEPVCRGNAADELTLGGLSGLELQHDIYLTLTDWSAWSQVSNELSDAGAELHSLQILRQSDGFSARCRVKHLSSEAARGLSGRLLDAGVAQRASVEHLMLTRPAAGRTP